MVRGKVLLVIEGRLQRKVMPKLRHKEERRRIVKTGMKKLRKIEDTDSVLCKSVLIVNTIRRISRTNCVDIHEDFNLSDGNDNEEEADNPEHEEARTDLEFHTENVSEDSNSEELLDQ